MKKILIIGAMKIETDELISKLSNASVHKYGAFNVAEGSIGSKQIIVCCCGIGKVNSSCAASSILSLNNDIELIVNIGVAGGLGGRIMQGDIVVADKTVQHDYNQTADGLKMGQVNGFDSEFFECDAAAVAKMAQVLQKEKFRYTVGTIASGDEFVNSDIKAAKLNRDFSAKACDMESAAIAQVAAIYNVPFLAMRAISDNGNDSALMSFYDFVTIAAQKSTQSIIAFMMA